MKNALLDVIHRSERAINWLGPRRLVDLDFVPLTNGIPTFPRARDSVYLRNYFWDCRLGWRFFPIQPTDVPPVLACFCSDLVARQRTHHVVITCQNCGTVISAIPTAIFVELPIVIKAKSPERFTD